MLFSSPIFLFLFLPLTILIYFVLVKFKTLKNIFLLVASLFFYAWGEPVFVWILIASTLVNYICGLRVEKNGPYHPRSKKILLWMMIYNLAILFYFKYLVFTIQTINEQGDYQLRVPQILLPIGISFFTFQGISYVIDIYRGQAKAQRNPLNVGLYIALFPQLVAGPIVRYNTIAEQINNRKESFDDVSEGICRFVVGLGKKILLSNSMAIIADAAFNDLSIGYNISILYAWLGAIAYALQIYYDFSGYSDMAIGLGRVFGFRFDENFNYPYIAKSVSEFWRRWHISLGTWFRDYVYFPLGGSRVKNPDILIRNLFVVWLLTGLWHGANWTFILWGLWFFLFIMIEKLSPIVKIIRRKGAIWSYVYTLFIVLFGWVLFRSVDIYMAFDYMGHMLNVFKYPLIDDKSIMFISEYGVFLLISILFSMPLLPKLYQQPTFYKFSKVVYPLMIVMLYGVCVTYLIKGTYNPFIYFNF